MMLRSGPLRKRITLQQQSPAVDGYGQQINNWVDVDTVWASIEPSVGRELFSAQSVNINQPKTVRMRWQSIFADPKAVSAMRMVYNGRVFNIHSVENKEEQNFLLTLLVSEGLTNG